MLFPFSRRRLHPIAGEKSHLHSLTSFHYKLRINVNDVNHTFRVRKFKLRSAVIFIAVESYWSAYRLRDGLLILRR